MKRVVLVVLAACGARTDLGGQDKLAAMHDAGDASDSGVDGRPPPPCNVTQPTVLFSGGKSIQFMALDDDSVFWTDFDLGTVSSIPKGGGGQNVIAPNRGNPSGLAVRDGKIYWTEFFGNIVKSASSAGGGSFTTIADDQDGAYDVAASESGVYWTTFRGCRVSREQNASTMQLDKAKQPFTRIVSAGSLAFWISFERKSIERFDASSQKRSTLVSGGAPLAIATDGKKVYFSRAVSAQTVIESVSVDGGTPETIYTSACDEGDGGLVGTCLAGLATDGDHVYFTSGDGLVREVPASGGPANVVADEQARPYAIAVDDSCVYWSNLGDGTIWAAPKL